MTPKSLLSISVPHCLSVCRTERGSYSSDCITENVFSLIANLEEWGTGVVGEALKGGWKPTKTHLAKDELILSLASLANFDKKKNMLMVEIRLGGTGHMVNESPQAAPEKHLSREYLTRSDLFLLIHFFLHQKLFL